VDNTCWPIYSGTSSFAVTRGKDDTSFDSLYAKVGSDRVARRCSRRRPVEALGRSLQPAFVLPLRFEDFFSFEVKRDDMLAVIDPYCLPQVADISIMNVGDYDCVSMLPADPVTNEKRPACCADCARSSCYEMERENRS